MMYDPETAFETQEILKDLGVKNLEAMKGKPYYPFFEAIDDACHHLREMNEIYSSEFNQDKKLQMALQIKELSTLITTSIDEFIKTLNR